MIADDIKRRVSSNIKKYRKIKHYTQTDLSNLTGINFQTIASIESCRVWTSDTNLAKIADVLDIDVYKLFLPSQDTLIYETEASELKVHLFEKIKKIIDDSYNELNIK